MEIGKITINQQPLLVLPPGCLSVMERSIDGILGINLLSKVALLCDFPEHKLTFLIPGDFKAPELQALGFNAGAKIPITQTPNSVWTTQAVFVNSGQTVSETLVVDTGSETTILSPLIRYSLRLKPVQENVLRWGHNGEEAVNTAPVDKIQIGPISSTDFPVDYASHAGNSFPANLGMNLLSRFCVLMDFPGGKMYIQHNVLSLPPVTIAPVPTPTGRTPTP